MSDHATLTAPASYPSGMTPLDLAVAAQANVNAVSEERRRVIVARDSAVCDAYSAGCGRTAIANALGVSVSTVDHILDRRRCG